MMRPTSVRELGGATLHLCFCKLPWTRLRQPLGQPSNPHTIPQLLPWTFRHHPQTTSSLPSPQKQAPVPTVTTTPFTCLTTLHIHVPAPQILRTAPPNHLNHAPPPLFTIPSMTNPWTIIFLPHSNPIALKH